MNTNGQYKFFLLHRQAGLSLVELMISLAIGMVLLLGITTLIAQQSGTRTELEKSGRQMENGRYATQLLHDDIEHAGFYSEYFPPAGTLYTTPDPCVTTAGNLGWAAATPSVPTPIFGYTGSAAAPSCVTNRLSGTAILVIRRTLTDAIPAAAAVAGTTYLQVSLCDTDTVPFVAGTSGFTLKQKDCATLSPLRKYVVRIYYVSSCDVCGSDTIPTLKMVEFMDGALTTVPLVEGIENMQFDYGVDTTGDGSPDSYSTAPANWENVMAIRVNLLARNNEISAGYTDTRTYHMGGAGSVTPGGAYKRHVYSGVARAVNPSGRREQP